MHDAKTVLSESGTAIMGSAKEEGENRARTAIVKALDSPLLNDNKITGAKNVLLLIVSGTNEVTLDEIGEINDYIQDEAGYDANIIMCIGEDKELGDAIAVTIVATGVAADQQSTITNTEVKKIVHTLEDEQKATYDFGEKRVVKSPTLNEPLTNKNDQKIVHILEEDTEAVTTKSNLVTTTNEIAEMTVLFEEVQIESISEDDFVITDKTPVQEVEVQEEHKKNQGDLLFDLPLNSFTEVKAEEEVRYNLQEDVVSTTQVNDLEVYGAEEIVFERKGIEKHFVLEDFDAQPTIGKSSSIVEENLVEEAIHFELKTREPQVEINKIETQSEEVSPLDLTITELKKRAEERRKKMKGFNYKFNDQMNKNIDEIERQPAYKRLGINLDTNTSISNAKTSISTDS